MVQTLGINSSNDIYLAQDGNIALLSGLNAVIDACATASKAQLGEMVLSINAGIPNFQTIWVGVPNYAIWESYLRNTLSNVEGVIEVQSIQFRPQNNTLSYTATILTEFGTGQVNG